MEHVTEDTGGFVQGGAVLVHLDGVLLQGRKRQFPHEEAAIGVRSGTEPSGALRDGRQYVRTRGAVLVEQFLGTVGAHPLFELPQVFRVVPHGRQRHLVGAPGALDRQSVHLGGAGPALGRAEHDHGPAGPVRGPVLAGGALDAGDAVDRGVHRRRHRAVDGRRVVTGDMDGIVTVAAQKFVQFGLREPGQHRRVGDLVAVQVQDRQYGAVADRVQELVGVPGGGQRAGLRLPVADHAGDQQFRVVEGRAVGVRQGVAEFTALVNGAGGLGGDMAGHPAGEGELLEQPGHAGRVPGDVRVGLGVRPLQPGVGEHGRAAVSGPPDAQRVQAAGLDDAVEVGVHQVQAG